VKRPDRACLLESYQILPSKRGERVQRRKYEEKENLVKPGKPERRLVQPGIRLEKALPFKQAVGGWEP